MRCTTSSRQTRSRWARSGASSSRPGTVRERGLDKLDLRRERGLDKLDLWKGRGLGLRTGTGLDKLDLRKGRGLGLRTGTGLDKLGLRKGRGLDRLDPRKVAPDPPRRLLRRRCRRRR
jgi:hypothetical protein